MELVSVATATDNFSDSNKIGHGGFGTGMLDGKAIAAKRLLKESAQGIQGFANEVMMIAECSTCQFSTRPWLLRRGRRNGNSV
ncbi:unnamed protein product [Brassica oleracea var. botrytis]